MRTSDGTPDRDENIVFFQLDGLIFPFRTPWLADDMGIAEPRPSGGFVLAYNVRERTAVDAILARTVMAGATILQPAHENVLGRLRVPTDCPSRSAKYRRNLPRTFRVRLKNGRPAITVRAKNCIDGRAFAHVIRETKPPMDAVRRCPYRQLATAFEKGEDEAVELEEDDVLVPVRRSIRVLIKMSRALKICDAEGDNAKARSIKIVVSAGLRRRR